MARVGGPTDASLPTHDPLGSVRPGIYLTLHARLPRRCDRRRHCGSLVREAYAGRPFVRLLDAPPELTHAVGTNYALINAASEDGSELQVMVAIDNLVKGPGAGHSGDEPGPGYR